MPYHCDLENRQAKEVVPGVRLRTFWGDEMLVSIADLEPGAVLPAHSHPHEQVGHVISGEIEITIDGEPRLVRPGDTFIIPGGVEHGVQVGSAPAQVLDVFSPVREDYQFD
jgi:quercetin dioxygenase-like cupin family protein